MTRCFMACLLILGLFALAGRGGAQEQPTPPAARPQSVIVILTIVELVPHKGADGKLGPAKKEFDDNDFTGPEQKVLQKVQTLMLEGLALGTRRIVFTAVENQQTVVATGEEKTYVDHVNKLITGKVGGVFQVRPTGTTAKATVQVAQDKTVTLDLDFREVRPYPSDCGVTTLRGKETYVYGIRPAATGGNVVKRDDGTELQVYEFITHALKTKLNIPPGETVVAPGVQATTSVRTGAPKEEKPGPVQIMVLVTARLQKPDGKVGP